MKREAHLETEKEMTDREQRKPREIHITKKTTWRNRHKWDEGAEQRQRQIFRLKV